MDIVEISEVNGGGFLAWIVPVAVGFIFGGPPGALVVAGTYVASQGVNNLEHVAIHHDIPSVSDSFGF